MNNYLTFKKQVRSLYYILLVVFILVVITTISLLYLVEHPKILQAPVVYNNIDKEVKEIEIKNGVHVPTGFIAAKGVTETIANCTNCHSAQLVIQNRMTREGWIATIQWMQKTQNLWDLGENEAIIVNYLAKNYAPKKKGRRAALTVDEWYVLESK